MDEIQIKTRQPFFDTSILTLLIVGAVACSLGYFIFHNSLKTLLVALAILVLGVQLPRVVGRRTRIRNSLDAKKKELKKWGFHSRDREGPWLNYIDYPLVKESAYAAGKLFYSEWLIIHDGKIIVNPGQSSVDPSGSVIYNYCVRRTYAWDGCTPKRFFFWFAILGTPDWWQVTENVTTLDDKNNCVHKSVFWQQAHHASLVHDALYQYLDSILARIYHFFVRYFGARDIREDDPKANTAVRAVFVPSTSREEIGLRGFQGCPGEV